MDNDKFRPVNRTLGAQPRIGPFALYQIAPFFLSLLFTYLLQGLLGFDWILGALIIWRSYSWITLVLLGKHPWRFFAQITDCPQVVRAGCYYRASEMMASRLIDSQSESEKSRLCDDLNKPNKTQGIKTIKLKPFEDMVHYQTMVEFQRRGLSVGAWLLKKNEKSPYVLTFGFECPGNT